MRIGTVLTNGRVINGEHLSMISRIFWWLMIQPINLNRQSKSDQAPHEWLPPRKDYWCEYGKRWEGIKDKYQLWSSSQERKTLELLVETCR